MKSFGLKFILKALLIFAIANYTFAFANSAPIYLGVTDNLVIPEPRQSRANQRTTRAETRSLEKKAVEVKTSERKTPETKAIEKKTIETKTLDKKAPERKPQETKSINTKQTYPSKQEVKKAEEQKVNYIKKDKNLSFEVKLDDSDKVLSESSRWISAIYPNDEGIASNSYPGYRGPNQLVIYNSNFARTTGTNEFGKEAVVIDGVVVKLTGANSQIPRNGYVVSGHGTAKKWISDNLKIGTKVEITPDKVLKAYTTIDSYRYQAKSKIEEVEKVLVSSRSDSAQRDDKYVYYYLKKAKQAYRKSQKDATEASLSCAKEAIESASMAFQYTLPYRANELKGTWIRPTEKSIQEVQRTLDKIKDTGINNVFLETYFHGMTIFPSRTMQEYGFTIQNPAYTNFDMLAVWIKEAHRRDIKVHCWFESFYIGNKSPLSNPKSILTQKPEWQNRTKQKAEYQGYVSHPQEHNGYFLDPANPEVTNFLLDLISEISARYNIDGFNIDYVRYPNISKENYSNQWGYTKFAREEFYNTYEVDPIDIEPRGSMWNNWCEYRQDKITDYIRKVSSLLNNRNIMFSAVIFPDYKVALQTKNQDWARWVNQGYLNAITPLILTSDDELAKDMLEEIKKKTSYNAKVYPGLFAGFIESDPEDLLRQIHAARKLRLDGIILFDWAHLNTNYQKVLKTSAFKAQTY